MTFLRAQKVWGSITDPESIGLSPDLLGFGATFEWMSDSVASNAMIASKINILRRQAPYIYFVANNDIAVSTLSLPYVNAMEKRELGRGVWLAYPDFKEETKTAVTAVLQGDILPFVHNLDNDHYCLLSLPQPIPLVQIDEIVMEEEDVAVSVHRLLADGGCLLTFIDSYVLQIVTFDMGYAKYFFTPSNTAEGGFLQ